MPTFAAGALVGALSSIVEARRLLVGKFPLLATPFPLSFPTCSAGLARVLISHHGSVETGCDSHGWHGRRMSLPR